MTKHPILLNGSLGRIFGLIIVMNTTYSFGVNAQEAVSTTQNPIPVEYSYDSSGNRVRRSPQSIRFQAPKRQDDNRSKRFICDEFSVRLDANSNIKVDIIGKDISNEAKVEVYNAEGMLMYATSISTTSTTIETAGYKDGVYIVAVVVNDDVSTWKCVIERK